VRRRANGHRHGAGRKFDPPASIIHRLGEMAEALGGQFAKQRRRFERSHEHETLAGSQAGHSLINERAGRASPGENRTDIEHQRFNCLHDLTITGNAAAALTPIKLAFNSEVHGTGKSSPKFLWSQPSPSTWKSDAAVCPAFLPGRANSATATVNQRRRRATRAETIRPANAKG